MVDVHHIPFFVFTYLPVASVCDFLCCVVFQSLVFSGNTQTIPSTEADMNLFSGPAPGMCAVSVAAQVYIVYLIWTGVCSIACGCAGVYGA